MIRKDINKCFDKINENIGVNRAQVQIRHSGWTGLGGLCNPFADVLATLAFVIEIPSVVTVRPLLIKTRYAPAYCCLIGDIEDRDELPWYHDIYQFMSCDAYLESSLAKDN